jgi:hypothetical protein
MTKKLLLCFALSMATFISHADDKVIRVNDFNDPNAAYSIKMLKLALAHIDTPYRVEVLKENFTQARINEEVRIGGALDLCWNSSDADLESIIEPIRIPLFKGLLGYRIFIINKNDQAKFDRVKSLDDLKQLSVGQGRTWADTRILESNGFNVIKTNKYPGLFYMVEGGRFDGFPRGVHEPFGELESRPALELTVERNLMIYYQMPFYLFVSKDNKKLKRDLEEGFEKAIADGSFDKTFLEDKSIKDVIEKANMKHRLRFNISNPNLSKETPLDRTELWFDPATLP